MNCQSCQARVDYNFLTNCAECGGEIKQATDSQAIRVSDPQPSESRRKWTRGLINLVYIIAGSMAGMISGGVIFYFSFAVIYLAFFSGNHSTPHHCGDWSDAAMLLSILSGAFLGIVGGTAFTLKKPLCRVSS